MSWSTRSDLMSDFEVMRYDSLVHALRLPVADTKTHARARALRSKAARGALISAEQLFESSAPPATILTTLNRASDSLLTVEQQGEKADLQERLARRAGAETAAAERVARQAFARTYESRLLDQGMNVDVTTSGDANTTLKVKWILVSKVLAHQISQDGELLSELRGLGFRRFVITDGYDETWYWDLSR